MNTLTMKRTAVAVFVAGTTLALSAPSLMSDAQGSTTDASLPSQRACAQEDSLSCVWDARHQGNGIGDSYWTGAHGHHAYYRHSIAHRLLHDTWVHAPERMQGHSVDLVHGGTRKVTEQSRVAFGGTTYVVWPRSTQVGTS